MRADSDLTTKATVPCQLGIRSDQSIIAFQSAGYIKTRPLMSMTLSFFPSLCHLRSSPSRRLSRDTSPQSISTPRPVRSVCSCQTFTHRVHEATSRCRRRCRAITAATIAIAAMASCGADVKLARRVLPAPSLFTLTLPLTLLGDHAPPLNFLIHHLGGSLTEHLLSRHRDRILGERVSSQFHIVFLARVYLKVEERKASVNQPCKGGRETVVGRLGPG